MTDLFVIGSGPAGLSAAIYAARAGFSVVVCGKDYGGLEKAAKVENYFGLEHPISGKELVDIGIKQAKSFGAKVIKNEVISLEYNKNFEIKLTDEIYSAKAVIIATGAPKKLFSLNGISDYEGKGVSYCAMCDGYFFKDKNIAIIGNGGYALHELEFLKPIASSVVVLTNGLKSETDFPHDIKIYTKKIQSIYGENLVEGITLETGEKIALNGIFVALGFAESNALASKLGVEISGKNIVVNNDMKTSLPGIFACGDCTGGLYQVCTAVYEGAKAGISAINYLKENKSRIS